MCVVWCGVASDIAVAAQEELYAQLLVYAAKARTQVRPHISRPYLDSYLAPI